MEEYPSPYVSVVPRLLPSQFGAKKIPMIDDGYSYNEIRPTSSYISPTGNQNNPLSTRTQLMNNDLIHQDPSYSNNSNTYKGQQKKNRFHLETLKDNSGDNSYPPNNSYPPYNYSSNYDYRPYEPYKSNSPEQNNNCSKILIIVFGTIIGLFALAALAISIYILIKTTNSSG